MEWLLPPPPLSLLDGCEEGDEWVSVDMLLGRFDEAAAGSSPADDGGCELAADVELVISVSWPFRRESISMVAPTYSSSTWQGGEDETWGQESKTDTQT